MTRGMTGSWVYIEDHRVVWCFPSIAGTCWCCARFLASKVISFSHSYPFDSFSGLCIIGTICRWDMVTLHLLFLLCIWTRLIQRACPSHLHSLVIQRSSRVAHSPCVMEGFNKMLRWYTIPLVSCKRMDHLNGVSESQSPNLWATPRYISTWHLY